MYNKFSALDRLLPKDFLSIPGHPIHKKLFFLWIDFIPVANPPLVEENSKDLSKLDILIGNLFETIIVLLKSLI